MMSMNCGLTNEERKEKKTRCRSYDCSACSTFYQNTLREHTTKLENTPKDKEIDINNLPRDFEFQVGDIVGHILYDGEFELLQGESLISPLSIKGVKQFGILSFTRKGISMPIHDKPSLYLIRRSKKKVKKTVSVVKWCVVNSDDGETWIYHDKPSAERTLNKCEILIPLTGSYEIEIEEE